MLLLSLARVYRSGGGQSGCQDTQLLSNDRSENSMNDLYLDFFHDFLLPTLVRYTVFSKIQTIIGKNIKNPKQRNNSTVFLHS